MGIPSEADIEAVWARHHIERIPRHDMSNECRLAAVILSLEDDLRKANNPPPGEPGHIEGHPWYPRPPKRGPAPVAAAMISARDQVIATTAKERDEARREREQALNRESMALEHAGDTCSLLSTAVEALRSIREQADGRRHYRDAEGGEGCFDALGDIRDAADKVLQAPALIARLSDGIKPLLDANPCRNVPLSPDDIGPGEKRPRA